MGQKIRKTGIDLIGDVPWGTHFCQFYQTQQDLIDILVPYFKAGLENNEFCLWVTSEPLSEKEVQKVMRKAVPNFDRYLTRGQIEIVPHSQWYLKDGAFNLQRVLKAWIDKLNQALAKGFDGMRVTGNTAWLEKRDWRNFAHYEEEVNRVIGRYRMIVICTYSLDRCGAFELIDVVNSHQFALIRREGEWELMESSERKQMEEVLQKRTYDLGERVKELNCLYGISDLVQKPGISLEAILQRTVNLISLAWQNPEITCAQITLKDQTFKTTNFKKTKWGQTADIIVHGNRVGILEVCYLEERPTTNEGPFLKEERSLIDGIAERLGKIIERKQVEEALQKAHHELEVRVKERTAELAKANEELRSEATERKKAEKALRESEEKYRMLFESANDVLVYVDKYGKIVDINKRAEDILGYKPDDVKGKKFVKFGVLKLQNMSKIAELFRDSISGKRTPDLLELQIKDRNGKLLSMEASSRVIERNGKIVGTIAILRDITERKKAEEKIDAYQKRLRSLMSELTLTEERHRRRIATELHDSIGQLLALCQIKLGQLEKVIVSPNSRPLLKKIGDSIEEIIRYTRSLTHQLSPFILYELGLEAALEWLAEFIYEQQGIQINLAVDSQANPVNEELRIFLFRAVQELLTNVTKHAKTDRAEVSLCRENESIRITIEDVGVGFNTAILDTPSGKDIGFGLFSIRERLRYFEGELSIQSEPGQGTQVTLTVPSKCHNKRSEGR